MNFGKGTHDAQQMDPSDIMMPSLFLWHHHQVQVFTYQAKYPNIYYGRTIDCNYLDFSCGTTMRLAFVVLNEISSQLFDGLPWYLVNTCIR